MSKLIIAVFLALFLSGCGLHDQTSYVVIDIRMDAPGAERRLDAYLDKGWRFYKSWESDIGIKFVKIRWHVDYPTGGPSIEIKE